MEASPRSRKRKDYSSLAACSSVVTRNRLRRLSDRSDRFRTEEELGGRFDLEDGGSAVSGSSIVKHSSPDLRIKDLRAHRVYSPDLGLDFKKDCVEIDGGKCLEIRLREIRVSDEGQSKADLKSNASPGDENVSCEGDGDFAEATPPEAVTEQSDRNGQVKEAKVTDFSDLHFGQQPSGEASPSSRTPSKKASYRPKVFGNPNSFSYRRLLPFLLDMTKGVLGNDRSRNLEKVSGAKPQLQNVDASSEVPSSVVAVETSASCGSGAGLPDHAISLSSPCEPKVICIENTADTTVPIDDSPSKPEDAVSVSICTYSSIDTEADIPVENSDNPSIRQLDVIRKHHGCSISCGNGKTVESRVSSEAMDGDLIESPKVTVSENEDINGLVDTLSEDVPVEKSDGLSVNHLDEIREHHGFSIFSDGGKTFDTRISSEARGEPMESPTELELQKESVSGLVDTSSYDLPNKGWGLGDANAAEKNGLNYDEPQISSYDKAVDNVQEILMDIQIDKTLEAAKEDRIKLDSTSNMTIKSDSGREQFGGFSANSTPKRKLYLRPCSERKIFKNPSSVSYRKLLPYLKEIYEDDTRLSSNYHYTKTEAAAIAENSKCANLLSCKTSDGHSVFNNPGLESSCTASSAHHSTETTPLSDSVGPELKSSECTSMLDVNTDLPTDSQMKDKIRAPVDPIILSHDHKDQTTQSSSSCPVPESLCISGSHREKRALDKDSNHLKSIIPLGSCPVSSRKGILKRNPRGCRGLCTCLKCASFRLHAEKAFEFSRNQFLDSQEMVSEMASELSLLRSLLLKSTEDASGHVSINTSQVREACSKAYAVEQQVKARIEQMNHELNIHCRIPNLEKPSVSFA